MKHILTAIIALILNIGLLSAEIIEIQKIDEILPQIESTNTLILFDMDDTLTDSTISLGSGAWRKYIRQKIADYETEHGNPWGGIDLHDQLTLYVARKVAVQPVETQLPQVIADLQNKGIPVFVFTARGKNKWYSTDVEGINSLTEQQLTTAGFNFGLTVVPPELQAMNTSYFGNGVIYTSPVKKGAFFQELLAQTNYCPSKLVFVDDKIDQVVSMDEAAKALGIPFVGFWYTRAETEHKNFDPIVATIQLKQLLEQGKVMGEAEALVIKEQIQVMDADLFFNEFLDHLDLSNLSK